MSLTGRRPLLAVLSAVVAMTACSGRGAPRTLPPPPVSSASTSATASTAGETVWLCRPGHRPNPCLSNLATTVVAADAPRPVPPHSTARSTDADCFYAYPTVSSESQSNADLRIQASERQVALVQAARFSPVCDVWSPIYHQRTIGALTTPLDGKPDSLANRTAYESLRAGWRSFLAAHDPRRPIVLIGHSQGASMLIRLLRNDVDDNPAVRRQIALALLLGGNLTVAPGKTSGGDLRHLPLCTTAGQ